MNVSNTASTYSGRAIQMMRNTILGANADISASMHPICFPLLLPYWRAMAIRRRSSSVIRWSRSSAASSMSICTHRIRPVNSLSLGP